LTLIAKDYFTQTSTYSFVNLYVFVFKNKLNNMKKTFSLITALIFLSLNAANAQNVTARDEAASVDFMRNTGMMYVVVGVILIIFIGIIVYLINIDRKLTKLENQINQNE
jgi:CcmD family protein